MGKKGRGRERQVTCEKCGRTVRRDKAVFYEKAVFINPVERSEVYDTEYSNITRREVAYCPSCGKHGRIYEKKQKIAEAQRERLAQKSQFGPRPPRPFYGARPAGVAPVQAAAQAAAPAQAIRPVQAPVPAEEKKAEAAAEKEAEEEIAEEKVAEEKAAEEQKKPAETHLERLRREVQEEQENQ